MDQTLLAILAGLVLAMIWVMKRQSAQVDRSIRSLTTAVDSFRKFEQAENVSHERIVESLQAITDTQNCMIVLQEKILHHVTPNNHKSVA